jgi:hypothetical protein
MIGVPCFFSAVLACGGIACAVEPEVVLDVAVDYAVAAGPLDKDRILNGSQGGYAAMRDLDWLPRAYDDLAAIGFKSIRLDHLVNDKFYRVVSADAAGKLRFDFSRLDRVIRPMLAKGITPFMCLSYCPDVLIPAGGSDGSPPKDLGRWQQIVRAYVQHYKDLGHTGWCWEVWNEPDIEWFFRGTAGQYVEMYAATVAAVKEADPTAKVGGAADAGVLSAGARLGPLLDYVKSHPAVPLDFVSYHKYGGSTRDEKPPYDLGWNVDEVRGMLTARGLAPRPIYVTEWNLTPVMDAGAGADSDTHRAAAGLAARLFNALDDGWSPGFSRSAEEPTSASTLKPPKGGTPTKVFYFAPLEGYRPKQAFGGDLGLLTVDYHKKAAYNVFKMFYDLGETRLGAVVSGPPGVAGAKGHPTYALATKDKDASRRRAVVLLWNYSPRPAAFRLAINNLPCAAGEKILVTRYRIDADHGNYYKDYASGWRGDKPGPSEELRPVDRSTVVATVRLERTIAMSPFSVVELVLEPVARSRDAVGRQGPVR